ncbi:MAG: T9SS type A sorting domain-containing protein, partial [Bacteroidota bacterium]
NKTNITKMPFTGIGASGNPTYDMSAIETFSTISEFKLSGDNDRGNIEYDSDHDIMYMISQKTSKAAKFSNWSTNTTTPDWIIPVEGSQCMRVAGDYLFTINGSTARIYVYALANGKYAGKITPNSPNGLVDIPYGLSAFRRSNGEYIVLAEEDYLGKVRVYRFSTFNPNTPPVVNITKPTANADITSASTQVTATASDTDGSIVKVQIFIDSVKVSDVSTYTWLNPVPGEHTIFAKAFDNYGDSTTSPILTVKVIATGLNQLSSRDAISMYPNPASVNLSITFSDKMNGIADISIFDSRGKAILKKKASILNGGISSIDLSGIPNGIYIVKVTSGDVAETLKLIISK